MKIARVELLIAKFDELLREQPASCEVFGSSDNGGMVRSPTAENRESSWRHPISSKSVGR